jgi:hypothetical protein
MMRKHKNIRLGTLNKLFWHYDEKNLIQFDTNLVFKIKIISRERMMMIISVTKFPSQTKSLIFSIYEKF